MDSISKEAVVINAATRIQNTPYPHGRASIQDRAGEHYASSPNIGMPADVSLRMDKGSQCSPVLDQSCELRLANSVIADGNHDSVKLMSVLKKILPCADYIPYPIGGERRPYVVEEQDLCPAANLRRIRNYLSVPTGTQDGKSFHHLLPVNFDMVASPLALIPSFFITFLMVKATILMSSQIERFSTYQTSSSNFSGQPNAFRPLI